MCDLTGTGQWSSCTVSAQPDNSPRRPVSSCTQGRSYISSTVTWFNLITERLTMRLCLHLCTAAARHISVRIPLHSSEILVLDSKVGRHDYLCKCVRTHFRTTSCSMPSQTCCAARQHIGPRHNKQHSTAARISLDGCSSRQSERGAR